MASARHTLDTPNVTPRSSATVLAFDFGEKRIGVAVADLAVGIAHALATIDAEDSKARFAAIAALITEWNPASLVVGEPRHENGGEHEIGRLARRFALRLEGRFGLPVALVDETLSSHAAQARLLASGLHRNKLKTRLDAAAACEIMETWLEQQRKKPPETP